MAIVTANTELRISSLEDWDGDLITSTATQIIFSDGFRSETYTGSFTYSALGEVFGTLNSLSESRGGAPFYSITDMSVDANAVYRAIEINGSLLQAAQIMLAGNDQINGSTSGSDELPGFGGDDVIRGNGGNDTLSGDEGDDRLIGGPGDDQLFGGTGTDTAVFSGTFADATATAVSGGYQIMSSDGTDTAQGVEFFEFSDRTVAAADLVPPPSDPPVDLTGTSGNDRLVGGSGNDRLSGLAGDDTLIGNDGTDTLNGGDGNDTIEGGATSADRRDTIFGGTGNDTIDAGYGNDLVYGQDGNDTIAGGFGADELFGQNGDDVITGSAFSDLVFGGAGDDFVNGGFGFDRINGGSGADKFFHAAADGHGSDWLQDYTAAEGDVLVFGGTGATASDFVVRFAHTATPEGERSGDDDVQEAFVNFRGETLWALVDGGGEAQINLQIGAEVFDLLA